MWFGKGKKKRKEKIKQNMKKKIFLYIAAVIFSKKSRLYVKTAWVGLMG